jgi:hypothetical protein
MTQPIIKIILKAALLTLATTTGAATAQSQNEIGTCGGILHRDKSRLFVGDPKAEIAEDLPCFVREADVKRVLSVCVLGRRCELAGEIDGNCEPGKCEISKVTSVSRKRSQEPDVSAARAEPLKNKTTLSCELGTDSYNLIVLTPSDETWPINNPTQGRISIDFGGYRFGAMLLGSYGGRSASPQKLSFAVTSNGDPDTLVAGTISGVTTAHPVLRVTKGAYISEKNKDVPCVLK